MDAKAVRRRWRYRPRLSRLLMNVLGHDWCGHKGPPLGGHQSIYVADDGVTRVFSMQDDGGFVGIGYPDEWQVIMRTKAARMFAWWTFKMWLKDLCGFRSWLYYLALHAELHEWKLRPYPRSGPLTRLSSHEEWRAEQQKYEPSIIKVKL